MQVAPLALVPLAAAAQLLTLIPLPLTVAQFSEAQSASALQLAPLAKPLVYYDGTCII